MASYFNADYYFAAKAKQLSTAEKPWTAAEVQAEFAKQGINAEDHFKTYGASEGLSPNPYFNEKEYLETKLKSLQENAATKAEWTGKSAADLKAAFSATGLTAAEHYEKAGAFETRADGTLLNPSNAFDANAYFAAKLAQLQKAGFDGADTMTVADVVKAVQAAGISPVSHLQAAGAAEAKADGIPLVQTVPSEQRVANDPARVATGEIVPSNYNPPSKAPAAAVAAPVTKPADVGGLSAAKPVVPTAPVKVPGDAGYIAPPPTLKDTNEKPVLPPTTTEGTGPNAGFLVVDPKTGTAEVVNPETGEVQGEVKVEVKPDGSITPPAPNAPVVDKDGNNTNDKPVDNNGKPVEPDTPSGGGDGGDSGGGTTPTFAVTKGDDGVFTVGTGNGAVTLTVSEDGLKYIFTPTTGTKVEVTKAEVNQLIVNSITLKGTAAILAGIKGLDGTGGAELTGEVAATVAELKVINDALDGTITLNAKTNEGNFSGSAADLAAAFNGITSVTGTMTIADGSTATLDELVTINKATTGAITLGTNTAKAAFSGSAADLAAAFDGITNSTGTLTITGDVAATLAQLKTISKATSETVVLNAKTIAADFTGSAEDILAAFEGIVAGTLTGKLTVADATDATKAEAILKLSTGAVTVSISDAAGKTFTVEVGDKLNIDPQNQLDALTTKIASDASPSAAGQWSFNTTSKEFKWYDTASSSVKTITLTGAADVNASGDVISILGGTFSVGFAGATYTVGTKNGDVVVTDDGTNFVFTPTFPNGNDASVTPVKIAKTSLTSTNTLVTTGVKVSGSAELFKTLHAITGDVTINDAGKVLAASLNTINGKATNVNLAASVTGIEGSTTDVKSALDANAEIIGILTKNVTLTDTASTVATVVTDIDNLTTEGVVDASKITTFTGTAAELAALFAAKEDGNITLKADVTATVSGGSDAATNLTIIGSGTTGTVTVNGASTITGTADEVTAALVTPETKVVLDTASTVTVSDTVTAAEGSAIAKVDKLTATFTVGVEDSLANLVSGSVGSVATKQELKDILADDATVNIIVTDATITAETLKVLDEANSSGTVKTSNKDATGEWTITNLFDSSKAGIAIAATASVDKIVFDALPDSITGEVAITSFTKSTDKIDVTALTTSTAFDAKLTSSNNSDAHTLTTGKIYLVTGGNSNEADKDASGVTNKTAAATLISGAATWTAASSGDVAYFVVEDADSTAIYKFTEDGTANEVVVGELTLVGTVNGLLEADDFVFTS